LANRFLCLLLIALLCASCDVQKMIVGVTPEQDLARAHHAFDLLRQHDLTALAAEYDPASRKSDLPATLDDLAGKIPDDAPVRDSVTYVTIANTNGHRTVALMLLYQFPTKWLQFDINTAGDSVDAMAIESLDVQMMPLPVVPVATSGPPVWLILAGLGLWLILMLVIYRRFVRKKAP
jgi:hypothetical protein